MFGVCNVKKVKRTDLRGLCKEANRTQEEHEQGLELPRTRCDWNRTADNVYLVQCQDWEHAIKDKVREEGQTKKIRKDAVYALSLVISASPDFFQDKTKEDILAYFQDVLKEAIGIYGEGDPSRVINAVAHFDEKTPHLHALIVPLHTQEKDGERTVTLNAKKVIGNRTQMHKAQDRLYKNVFQRYGLERGTITIDQEPEERRKHQDTAAYYEAQRQTTLTDLTQAQTALVEVNRETLAQNVEALDKATESLEQAKKAIDKARYAITKQGQEYKVQDAVHTLELSAKALKTAEMAQIGQLRKAEKLTQNIEQAIDQRAETKLANARANLLEERTRLKAYEKALLAREKALTEKEKNLEQTIEERAQIRAQSLSQRFMDRVKRFLGLDMWQSFLAFQAQEKAKELDIVASKVTQTQEQAQTWEDMGIIRK